MNTQFFLDKYAPNIIATMHQNFDSHDFIRQLIKDYEKEYVEMIYEHKDRTNGIFRALHAEIGRYLSENFVSLKIQKTSRIVSANIKGYKSENQNRKK
jgi:hypothetical protein